MSNLLRVLILVASFSLLASEIPEPHMEVTKQGIFSSIDSVGEALGTLVVSVLVGAVAWRTYKELLDPTYRACLIAFKLCVQRRCHRTGHPTIDPALEQL